MPPDKRTAIRQAGAEPAFDGLETWLNTQLHDISGKSPLASAIRHALTRMARMRPSLVHGILEIDNNTAGRAMRSVALGRKNSIFVGPQTGGKSAAIACTLIGTPSSIESIPKPGSPTRLPAFQTTRSTGSMNCCHGTRGNCSQTGRLGPSCDGMGKLAG